MYVPPPYLINHSLYSKRTNKQETIGGFKKSKVASYLTKCLKDNDVQKSCQYGIELDISGFEIFLWDKLIDFAIKNINSSNPNLPFYIWRRTKILDNNIKNKLILTNIQTHRNHLIEFITILALASKKKFQKIPKLYKHDFNLNFMKKKLVCTQLYPKILNRNDPKELFLPVNEISFLLHSSNIIKNRFQLILYWIQWILEWEKKYVKKYKKPFNCSLREHNGINKKNQNDWVWIIWDIVLKKIQEDRELVERNNQVLSLYKLFCWKYSKTSKNKRLYFLRWAILYIIPSLTPIVYTIPICNYPKLILKCCLSVNNIYIKSFRNSDKYFTPIKDNDPLFDDKYETIKDKSPKKLISSSDKKIVTKKERIYELEKRMKQYETNKPIIPF